MTHSNPYIGEVAYRQHCVKIGVQPMWYGLDEAERQQWAEREVELIRADDADYLNYAERVHSEAV